MGETDWTTLSDELAPASLDRGVTTGETPPSGGGDFVFGFNSLVTSAGAAGLFTNQAGFAPTGALKGGSIRSAIKRGPSSGDNNHAPALFMLCQGTSVNDHAYLLGLSDEEPSRIVLAKLPIVQGLPSSPVLHSAGVLGVSSLSHAANTWLQLRLDAIVNINGDVLLQCFENDVTANGVSSPVWTPIAGLANFVDDQLGVNSQLAGVASGFQQPFTSGRMGYSFRCSDISRRGWFDQVEAFSQN